jgi:predicted AlkP superfamily phosphohydrolase/phosphomutase
MVALAAVAMAGGCGRSDVPPRVVLIGIDGMDWKLAGPLMDAGKMPNLARLVRSGARADLRALARDEQVRSAWICIATGRVLRAADAVPPISPDGMPIPGVRTWGGRPVWEIIGERDRTVGIVNWPLSYPASEVNGWMVTNGVTYAPEDGLDPIPNLTWPPALAAELGSIRKPVAATTDDEIGGFMNGEIWKTESDQDVRTRAQEFRAMWAADQTVLQVAVHFLDSRGQPDFTAVFLDGLLQASHPFWGPMDPASVGSIDRKEVVETFRDVIPRYYERVDGIIGELLAHVDENSTVIVCSGFGFRGPQYTPEGLLMLGTAMHGEIGVLAAAGPGIGKRTIVADASVLDLAPTILAVMGIPVPRDMDGFVATDVLDPGFLDRHPVTYVDSYGKPRPAASQPSVR